MHDNIRFLYCFNKEINTLKSNENEPYFDLINDIMIEQEETRVKFGQGK